MARTAPLNAILVGYGYWGSKFFHIANRVDTLRIVGVVDIRCGEQDFAGPASVPCSSDLSAALADPHVEAAIITTTASEHVEPIDAALQAGKHVFTEKPFTLAASTAADLLQLARERELMLTVDHQYWWSAEVDALGRALADKAIGDVVAVSLERAADGPVRYDVSALWDLAIHDLSMLVRLGVLADGDEPCLVVEDCRETMDGPVAGCVALTGTTPSKVTVRLHACWISRTKRRALIIAGERGSLRLEESDHFLTAWLVTGRRRKLLSRTRKAGRGTPIELALDEFSECARDRPDLGKAADAVRVVAALEQIQSSAAPVTRVVRSPRCWL